jgi:hypothetical protein
MRHRNVWKCEILIKSIARNGGGQPNECGEDVFGSDGTNFHNLITEVFDLNQMENSKSVISYF